MKNNLFSIGEISRLKGINIKTLRFYDEIGVIKPYYIDPFTKYRYYSADQFILIDIVKALKSMQVSTKDMAKIIKDQDTDALIGFLSEQKKELSKKILEIGNAISLIDTAKSNIEESKASLLNSSVFYKYIDTRYVLTCPLENMRTKNSLMMAYSKLYKIIEQNNLMNTYESGCLYEMVDSAYIPTRYFCSIKLKDNSNTRDLIEIPGGKFLCICYSQNTYEEQLLLLNNYIETKNYHPLQILQVELINEVFKDTEHFELQILIENKS